MIDVHTMAISSRAPESVSSKQVEPQLGARLDTSCEQLRNTPDHSAGTTINVERMEWGRTPSEPSTVRIELGNRADFPDQVLFDYRVLDVKLEPPNGRRVRVTLFIPRNPDAENVDLYSQVVIQHVGDSGFLLQASQILRLDGQWQLLTAGVQRPSLPFAPKSAALVDSADIHALNRLAGDRNTDPLQRLGAELIVNLSQTINQQLKPW